MKETLRDIRIGNGSKISDIAKVLCVSANAVSNYEVGIRRLSLEQVLKLSEHYQIPAEDVIRAQLNSALIRKSE